MASPLLSYSEAAEQVHRYILVLARGREIPAPDGMTAPVVPVETQKKPSPPKIVPLSEAAGRVLAEPIRADRDQPPFPRSTRDGFACRSTEANSHQLLLLAGHVRAGEAVAGSLGGGEAWEIMTGAAVPDGANAVFMVEHAEQASNQASNFVRLAAPRTVAAGENIVPRGAEARAGDLLVQPGIRLGPAQIALAAQCGYSQLAVAPRPRIAILSTGDELVPVDGAPGPSQIRNSNSSMLAALVAAAGGEPIVLPTVPDREAELEDAIRQALAPDLDIDMLLVTGGISAGKFDLVEDALTRAGARFFFRGVAIQPGKPVVFGELPTLAADGGKTLHGLPVLALPGNPISSAVTFHLFAAPLLAALGNDSGPQPCFALAELAGEWRGKPGLTRFLPAWCDFGPTPALTAEVRLIPWQGSGDIAAFARSNCFLVIPANAHEICEGSIAQILLT